MRAGVVWDAIALHTTPEIPWHKPPEIALVTGGVEADVLGEGLDEIPTSGRDAVLAAYPRIDFKLTCTPMHGSFIVMLHRGGRISHPVVRPDRGHPRRVAVAGRPQPEPAGSASIASASRRRAWQAT